MRTINVAYNWHIYVRRVGNGVWDQVRMLHAYAQREWQDTYSPIDMQHHKVNLITSGFIPIYEHMYVR